MTGQPSHSPQHPGLAFRPRGGGSEGQICLKQQAPGPGDVLGPRRGGHGRDPRSQFTQDHEGLGREAGSQLLWGRPHSHPGPACPLPAPRRGKATLLGTDPRLQSWLKSKVHFPHILKATNSKSPGCACLHYCCTAGPGLRLHRRLDWWFNDKERIHVIKLNR